LFLQFLQLQAAVNQFDADGEFQVELVQDNEREFSVLEANIVKKTVEENVETLSRDQVFMNSGIQATMDQMFENVEAVGEKSFEDYELGIQNMSFTESVEIIEAYLDTSQLTPLDVAIAEVVKEQEKPGIYEVVAGDTMTEIAIKVNIPMDKIWEMNKDTMPSLSSFLAVRLSALMRRDIRPQASTCISQPRSIISCAIRSSSSLWIARFKDLAPNLRS